MFKEYTPLTLFYQLLTFVRRSEDGWQE